MNNFNQTQIMIANLQDVDFLSKEQALNLAKQAFPDYSKRSKQAKEVESVLWDMILANGCPNRIFNKVELLVGRYES